MLSKILTPENLQFMLYGAGMSLLIALLSLVLGVCLGVVGASCKLSKWLPLRAIGNVYVEIIRGTPMLLQILFIFLILPSLISEIIGSRFTLDPFTVGVIAMSINSGAYTTELIRAGISSIDKGQWEAGRSLGMSYFQIMRSIILPQAFKRIIPPMVSEFIVLIKDSSLISTIGAVELLRTSQILGARYYNYLIPLALASCMYLVLTLSASFAGRILERRMAVSD